MGFDFQLKYTPGEQISHADAFRSLDFEDDDDNDRICFALENIYFVQSDFVTQAAMKTELRLNRLFQGNIKRVKRGIWKQRSEAEKGFEQQKNALNIHNGIIFRGVVPFIPPKLRPMVMAKALETHLGKNGTETAIRIMTWWPGISQDVLRYVSKCKECQENRPSLGKTVSTWPEAKVWERLHMDWGYVKDQGNILVIVGWIEAFPMGYRTSQTVKVYLSQIYGTKDQNEKRLLAVKSRLREKNFTINEKKPNLKPVSSVSFLACSVSKEILARDPKHVEKIKNAKPPSNMKTPVLCRLSEIL